METPKNTSKTRIFSLRITETDRKNLLNISSKHNTTASAFVRRHIMELIKHESKWKHLKIGA
jgi:hypothetical protein